MAFIRAYCRINGNSIVVDGKEVFVSERSMPDFASHAYEALAINYPKFYKMDSLSKLGFLAAECIMKDENGSAQPYKSSVILSNSGGSLDTDFRYNEASLHTSSPALFVYTLPNIVAGELSIRHGIKGESNFFVSSAYDPDFLSSYIEGLFKSGITTCMGGWLEVLADEIDIFLYLIKTEKEGLMLEHTAKNLKNLYYS